MNRKIRDRLRKVKRRIERRLAGARVELADKTRAIGVGGIGLVHRLAQQVGLSGGVQALSAPVDNLQSPGAPGGVHGHDGPALLTGLVMKPESGCSGPPQPSAAQTCQREPT